MEALKTFMLGAGGAALVGGLLTLVDRCLSRWATHKADTQRDLSDQVTALSSMVANLITANRAQLYDRIKYLGKRYIKQGYVTVEELEDLDRMHSVYHSELNGNGFLDKLMETVHMLPVRAS